VFSRPLEVKCARRRGLHGPAPPKKVKRLEAPAVMRERRKRTADFLGPWARWWATSKSFGCIPSSSVAYRATHDEGGKPRAAAPRTAPRRSGDVAPMDRVAFLVYTRDGVM